MLVMEVGADGGVPVVVTWHGAGIGGRWSLSSSSDIIVIPEVI